jgi:hypothetical protein
VLWNRSRSLSKSFERGWVVHDRLEVFFGNQGDKRSQLINTQPKIAIKRQSVLVDFDAYVPVLAGDTKHLSLNVKHPSLDWPATWKARILCLPAASGKIGVKLIFYSDGVILTGQVKL